MSTHVLDVNRDRIGTYNAANPDHIYKFIPHFITDMLPYYMYGNLLPVDKVNELTEGNTNYWMKKVLGIQNTDYFAF